MSLLKARIACLIGSLAVIVFLLLSGGVGGCSSTGGTETGNTQASLRIIGYQSSQLVTLGLSSLTVGSLEVTTARVVLDRIHFRPFAACNDEGDSEGAQEIQFDGPFVVDLLNPAVLSGLEDVSLAPGRYCRIEMVFKQTDSSDPILNRSILVIGARADGTPFQMSTEVDEEFELKNETTGFLIEAVSDLAVFFIGFDLDRWFLGINLFDPSVEVSSDPGGEPLILINDDVNEEIQEQIEDNIKISAGLFEDQDGDEDLDLNEEEDSLADGKATP